MIKLFFFITGTIGLVLITNLSPLFKVIREYFSKWHLENSKDKFAWMFHSLFTCSICFGFWSGIIVSMLVYRTLDINTLVYGLSGSCVCGISVSLIQNWNRKN